MSVARSIRARMTIGFGAAIGGLTLLAVLAISAYTYRTADVSAQAALNSVLRKAQSEAREADAEQAASKGPELAALDLSEILEDSGKAEHRIALLVLDDAGRISQRSSGSIPAWPHLSEDGWRLTSARVGRRTLVVGVWWRAEAHALRAQTLLLLGLGLLMTAAVTVGAWLLVGRTLAPISVLAQQAESAAVDAPPLRLKAPSNDLEITRLVETLNGMLSRLAETAAVRGRFYAAASHELRTPLQALSGHLELALSRDRSAEEYRALVAEAQVQARRLTCLVQDLLLLHQLETGGAQPETLVVDLADLCARTLDQCRPLASERGLRITLDLPDEALITAPRSHAEILTRNLVENAVRYARREGWISVGVEAVGSNWLLTIRNDADSDAPAGRRIEPFGRGDTARTSGGYGLGLAICRALTRANGWEMDWRGDEGEVRVQVRLGSADVSRTPAEVHAGA